VAAETSTRGEALLAMPGGMLVLGVSVMRHSADTLIRATAHVEDAAAAARNWDKVLQVQHARWGVGLCAV
jgi:hypothetical protein